MSTGVRIKEIRQAIGLTQAKFAKRIAISTSYLAEIEKGSKQANERIVHLICLEFNINENWLKSSEGSMFDLGIDAAIAKMNGLLKSLDEQFRNYAINQLEELAVLNALIRDN